ncbi:MAG TPA: efflux RND transporter periplasmic adaptor subunit [Longimicrobium sp.]
MSTTIAPERAPLRTAPKPAATIPAPPRPGGPGGLRAKKLRSRVLLAFGALLLVAMGVIWTRPEPVDVEVGTISRGDLRVTVDEEGMTRVHDRFVVAAPVAGRLQRIALEEGDRVAAGDVVASIAAAPLDARTARQGDARVAAAEAAVAQARARASQAQAAHAQALREAARARTLAGAGAISESAREQAELAEATALRDWQAARAAVRTAAAELSGARAALADASPATVGVATVTEVRSPVAGRVLRVPERSERAVAPGAPLVELGDARALEVTADVLSTDAVRIRPGMPVLIEEWGGGPALRGRVRTVSPAAFTKVSALGVEEQRVRVFADLDAAPAALGDGYRVEARIVVWEGRDVVKVPVSALFRTGGEWSVFVLDARRARLRSVRIGQRGEAEAEVAGGLRPGERVVLYPSDKVKDGVKVRVR